MIIEKFLDFFKKKKKSNFSGGMAFREYILSLPKEERDKAKNDPEIRNRYGLSPIK